MHQAQRGLDAQTVPSLYRAQPYAGEGRLNGVGGVRMLPEGCGEVVKGKQGLTAPCQAIGGLEILGFVGGTEAIQRLVGVFSGIRPARSRAAWTWQRSAGAWAACPGRWPPCDPTMLHPDSRGIAAKEVVTYPSYVPALAFALSSLANPVPVLIILENYARRSLQDTVSIIGEGTLLD